MEAIIVRLKLLTTAACALLSFVVISLAFGMQNDNTPMKQNGEFSACSYIIYWTAPMDIGPTSRREWKKEKEEKKLKCKKCCKEYGLEFHTERAEKQKKYWSLKRVKNAAIYCKCKQATEGASNKLASKEIESPIKSGIVSQLPCCGGIINK